jgi:hypothetical protein
MNPGDVLEGTGLLLQHGRLIAGVDYHLTIPHQTHFVINPTGSFKLDYEDHLGGFVLVKPEDAEKIAMTEYTLELASKSRKTIRVERRYKQIDHKGKERVSFWVKVV